MPSAPCTSIAVAHSKVQMGSSLYGPSNKRIIDEMITRYTEEVPKIKIPNEKVSNEKVPNEKVPKPKVPKDK